MVDKPKPTKSSEDSSLFFATVSRTTLAISKVAAGAGVLGLLGFAALSVVAGVFFVTENYFVSMCALSIALLVYVTGAEVGKLFLSAFTVFFSSKHVIANAAYLQETLVPLRKVLLIRRDAEGNVTFGPLAPGAVIKLPDNPLARDLQAVLEKERGYEYGEYVAHSYYVECHELYDHSADHLDFVSGAMPLFGLMGTVLALISMFDSLGSVVTVEQLSPQLALALKTTLYGALYSSLYKISASRFEQRLKGLGYDFDTLCRALKVLFDNKAVIEVAK
jgi:biopolymer transport protein ExbB/TolQ